MDLETVSHYKIIGSIGSGGMGEVFLAEDTRLGRRVALKMLLVESASDSEKISRFEKEARAASALNHPNILTVYDIGEIDSRRYLVTEYVEGQTLRDYFSHGPVPIQKAVDIICDVAKALFAAHGAGIVHRDIKPENVMIRRDGLVKVLDFGLAKLSAVDNTQDPLVITAQGIIMGTPKYMSPEQIRGLDVDQRADIFSLGVIFYEIIAGVPPFDGSTVSDIIASVLTREPASLQSYQPATPTAIQKIINRCLEKDSGARYQTMISLIVDLEKLKNGVEFDLADQSVTLRMEGSLTSTPVGGSTTSRAEARWTSEGQNPDRSGRESRRSGWLYLFGALALILLIVGGYLGIRLWMPYVVWSSSVVSKAGPEPSAMTIKRLTTNGKAVQATVSRDGKYLAYVVEEAGKESLWVRHVPTAKSLELIPPSASAYEYLEFSPDGNYIYFLRPSAEISTSEIFVLPVLGGTQRKVIGKTNNFYALSPDGQQIVFSRFSADQEEASTIIANIDGTNERTIATDKGGAWLDAPAWSPDGTRIAFAAGNTDKIGSGAGLVEIRLADLRRTPVGTQEWDTISRLSFMADGSGILMVAKGTANDPPQIWSVSDSDGTVRRVTNDLNYYSGASSSAVSKEIVTVQASDKTGVWLAEGGDTKKSRQITSGAGQDGQMGISWTPDGKLVYASYGSGRYDIWIMDGDGNGQRQLTANVGSNIEPVVSRDGRSIFFASDRSDSFSIWKMDIDGNNPIQLTTDQPGRFPACTADGKWVIFQSLTPGKDGFPGPGQLWRVSSEGGQAEQLTKQNGAQPVISPDGGTVAFYSDKEISLMPVTGGETKKAMGAQLEFAMNSKFRALTLRLPYFQWLPDNSGLVYIRHDTDGFSLWKILRNKTGPEKISDFDGLSGYFSWSPDGKNMAYTKYGGSRDIVLIDNW